MEIQALPVPPSLLGESPFWHPEERRLYWIDIPGRLLNRYDPQRELHEHWSLASEPGACAPLLGGGLLLAMRDGLWRFDPETNSRSQLAAPPYDPARQRFNDGKADPQGRFWVGTIDDLREPRAALYRHAKGRTERQAEGATTSNGLGFSPDGRTMYWADTKAHAVYAFDFDAGDGSLSRRRVFQQFAMRGADAPLETYGGRPDGAAVDSEGAYWVAMYEGQRLLRLSASGETLGEIPLPVRCPTMPCFGGDDLRTLYVTTARDKRPADELALQPWAGCVLVMRVEVPGLPVNFARCP
ncbi:SMP-30/gluconolactonase/LRE family protein [Aquincola sp. S2]|uniref:SMP-30/gluconolactonase/LRE family protein n=1 Tax=Pseudaquabacterium terrae TaxID=2732868 RepID=A0ABX2ELX9_9BURK|nr:SMP-30/gluconolactonase/LRE family protein [Aquabacterium terrae]NRF69666.1 SMP-30/gluconolactonase/LRE family protein [Aquabacterium terrae]